MPWSRSKAKLKAPKTPNKRKKFPGFGHRGNFWILRKLRERSQRAQPNKASPKAHWSGSNQSRFNPNPSQRVLVVAIPSAISRQNRRAAFFSVTPIHWRNRCPNRHRTNKTARTQPRFLKKLSQLPASLWKSAWLKAEKAVEIKERSKAVLREK